MELDANLAALEYRHKKLEDDIIEALQHPSTDTLEIAELKKRKLKVKEAIVRRREFHE